VASSDISDIVRQLLDGMHTISKTETIVGEPLQAGDATLLPIHRVKIGFAAATAKGKGQATLRQGQSGGRGAGGTVQLDPVAVIAVGADGTPRVLAVDGEAEGGLQRLLEQVPDLLVRAAKAIGDRVGSAQALTAERSAAASPGAEDAARTLAESKKT
jgi:uncharacterized spore protein YtfJ